MKIDIDLPNNPKQSKISIDGKEIQQRVKSLKISASVDTIPTVILELIPDELHISGEALVLKEAGLEDYSTRELLDIVAKRFVSIAAKECDK